MKFIVGAGGRLGQALSRHFNTEPVYCLERAQYDNWGATDGAARFLDSHAGPGDTILVAAGLLDPAMPAAEHVKVNVALPSSIIAAAADRDIAVVTFGTVMETLQAHPNAYVSSKVSLARIVAAAAVAGPVTHVRVHTLYGGGAPSPFMFLGQILTSLRTGLPFEMTSGLQLREYHHVDDEARAIGTLCEAGVRGVVDLSSGAPVRLRELAIAIFEAFGASEMLRLGARAEPAEENYGAVFQPHPLLGLGNFRPAVQSVVKYLQTYV